MRGAGVVFVVVLVVASCGGGDNDAASVTDSAAVAQDEAVPDAEAVPDDEAAPEGEASPEGSDRIAADTFPTETVEVAEALTGAMGDTDGFVAFVSALTRGYTIEQIIPAARDGRIDPDGTIVLAGGGPEQPAGPPQPVLKLDDVESSDLEGESLGADTTSTAMPVGFASAAVRQSDDFEPTGLLFSMRDAFGKSVDPALDAGAAMIMLITELAKNGFSLAQVVFAAVAGGGVLQITQGFCWGIVGEPPARVTRDNACAKGLFRAATGEDYFLDDDPEPPDTAPPEPTTSPTTTTDDEGDVEAWCSTYDQFVLSIVVFFDEFLEAGLSAEGGSDAVRDRFLPEFEAFLEALVPNSPGSVRGSVEALESAGMGGIGSDVGMGVEREGYFLEIDDFAEANCGFSIQSYEE